MMDITIGQFYPGESFLHKLDARTKIISTMFFVTAVFLASSHIAQAIVFLFLLFIIGVSGLPFKMILKSIKPLKVIIIFTLLIHAFTAPGEPIWSWWIMSITREGIEMGVLMSMRLVYLIIGSSLLTFTTSPIVLTDGIENLLNKFKRFGVPAHELAMMMTIALRFIPTLLEEMDRIVKAQMARGADFTSGNLIKRAKNLLPILIPLFISAFRRADDLATAMEARCYRGGEGRTRMNELVYGSRDIIAFMTIGSFTILLAGLKWSGI